MKAGVVVDGINRRVIADDFADQSYGGPLPVQSLCTERIYGAVLLDENNEVIRPALIWCDQRTEAQAKELERTIGLDRLIQLTCNPPLTNFTLTKLLWVRENEPQNWTRVRHVMLPKDYIRYRLTSDRAIDMADASGTLMLDVTNRRWSIEILRGAKIPQESS